MTATEAASRAARRKSIWRVRGTISVFYATAEEAFTTKNSAIATFVRPASFGVTGIPTAATPPTRRY